MRSSIVGGSDLAVSRTAGRATCFKVEFMWDGINWDDQSAYVMSGQMLSQASDPRAGVNAIGNAIADTASITVNNASHRFTPWHSASPLHAYIGHGAWRGIPIQISLGYKDAGGTDRVMVIFLGVLNNLTPTVSGQNTTFECIDKGAVILQHKGRSTLLLQKRTDEIIEAYRLLIPVAIRPTLVADHGMFTIPYACINDENIWSAMGEIAQTEGGRLYFDYAGNLVFENAAHFLNHASSLATFTIDDWAELQAAVDWKDYKNQVEVWYAPFRLDPRQEVWRSPEIHRIKAGETKTVTADFSSPAYSVVRPVADTDYIATTTGNVPRNVDISIAALVAGTNLFAQQAELAITNGGSYDLYMRLLRLRGRPLKLGEEEKVEANVNDALAQRAGKCTLTIRDNLCLQTKQQAESYRDFLLDRYSVARESGTMTNVDIMPWLELGDRVTVTEFDAEQAGVFFVHSIGYQFDRADCRMNLKLQAVDLYAYSDYFKLGTSILGTGAGKGRYFY